MTRPDLSHLTPEEKDALILALLECGAHRGAGGEAWGAAEDAGQFKPATEPRPEGEPSAAAEARLPQAEGTWGHARRRRSGIDLLSDALLLPGGVLLPKLPDALLPAVIASLLSEGRGRRDHRTKVSKISPSAVN
jgi:hypothetical protein